MTPADEYERLMLAVVVAARELNRVVTVDPTEAALAMLVLRQAIKNLDGE